MMVRRRQHFTTDAEMVQRGNSCCTFTEALNRTQLSKSGPIGNRSMTLEAIRLLPSAKLSLAALILMDLLVGWNIDK